MRESIGCDNFDVVGLEDDIDLFVDDEGAINGSPLNLCLSIVAHTLGTPAVLFGNAVALGCDPKAGESISLTDAVRHRPARGKPGPGQASREEPAPLTLSDHASIRHARHPGPDDQQKRRPKQITSDAASPCPLDVDTGNSRSGHDPQLD